MLNTLIVEAEAEAIWINQMFNGLELPADERSMIAAGCLDMTVEHQSAVFILFRTQRYGSMFSLLRTLFESLGRGLWLAYCATDIQLAQYKRGKLEKYFKILLSEVEVKLDGRVLALERFFTQMEKHLHDFTHTGFQQVVRRYADNQVRGNYAETEIRYAINLAVLLGLHSAQWMAELAGDDARRDAASARMGAYAIRYRELVAKMDGTEQ